MPLFTFSKYALIALFAYLMAACASVPSQQQLSGSVVQKSGAPLSEAMELTVSVLKQGQGQAQVVSAQRQVVSFLPAYYSITVPANTNNLQLLAQIEDKSGALRYRSSVQPLNNLRLEVDEIISAEASDVRLYDCVGTLVRYTAQTGQPTLYVNGVIELLSPMIGDQGIFYQGQRFQLQFGETQTRFNQGNGWVNCRLETPFSKE